VGKRLAEEGTGRRVSENTAIVMEFFVERGKM